ncbi:MAG: response regulator transcription factor [Chloroflexota bacterium]|nr:response regulator transcription factor [Chloroflexota bacterium]
MRILIIEDEAAIVRFLERGLEAHGHQVLSADNGEDGVVLALDETIDLVLLDISLPGLDGHQVLARVRANRPALPVLMLTARDDLQQKVSALNAGADDYLTKPFAFAELLARIHALSRRSDQREGSQLRAGDLRLDLLAHRAWLGETPLDLTSREYALLEYFMRHPGQVLSRQQILAAVWELDFDPESNIVDVYVRYLRRKVNPADGMPLITTIRGTGYRFDPPAI